MKYHLTGYGVSAALHVVVLLAALPMLIWQDKLKQPEEQPGVNLSLAQFGPAPPPPPPEPAPPVVQEKPLPESPVPKSKPVEKPKPQPKKKLVEKPKPKPEKKLAKKPQPRLEKRVTETEPPMPVPRPRPAPEHKPRPVARPAAPVTPRQAVSAPAPKPAQTAPAPSNPGAEAAYRRKLQSLIASRKKYPRLAEKAEIEGSVVLAFTVMPNGVITGVRVRNSSGNDWLDKAAVQAVNAASGALPFPPDIRKPSWPFSLTVNFKLDW